jgi:phosphoribosylaminoimidazole-succinocarboxamide synthase
MKKNQKLEKAVITPTSKSDEHDENLTPKQIVETGLLTQEMWDRVSKAALALFERGQQVALERGLILVDTKYEFGIDENGELTLVDEIHTPDSSRYWFANSYESRIAEGLEPEYFDKEFLRLWFKENCDPYKDATLPDAPKELIVEMSRRYIDIYQRLTGKDFEYNTDKGPIEERIENNLKKYVVSA